MAACHRGLILTGGLGTGKSVTCKTIVALWQAMTGQEAKTVHRLLEFDPKTMKFKRTVDYST
ncbi:MAG: hypothetical protein NW224_12550 [Leptolyngbyaceae cyanobacterium bins.302]|nr:hypothetical protein [Leptolyngbyaceae cyanobacterium bins.302]